MEFLKVLLCIVLSLTMGGVPAAEQPAVEQPAAPEVIFIEEVTDPAQAACVKGTVVQNGTQAPVSGANVTLTYADTGAVRHTATDESGSFSVPNMPAGGYVITIGAEGFKPLTTGSIPFMPGFAAPVTLKLQKDMDRDEEVVQKVMAALGEDLIARLRAENIDISFSFAYLTRGGEPSDDGLLTVSIEMRSPVGSVRYGNYQVNAELFAEAQMAIIDSGAFDLSAEDIAELKSHRYSQKNNYADVDLDCNVNLHLNHTPNDEAIMFLRYSGDTPSGYSRLWYSTWDWDTLSYNNKP